ncbi:response regulator [Paraburkholderia caffeinilytica]|uniref:response regulator n=1 Tax=Paraburkholderia caffeinilytica TaxID=1761016 RepID=UPI003DA0108B
MATQILVVDDDVELLGSLADFLGREGMAVSVLHEMRSLGEQIEREPPDLIVLDQIMHGVSGLAALSKLRADGNTVPVILASGPDDTDRIVGLEMGADDCIGKPFNPRELLARMRAVLRRRTQSAPVTVRGEPEVVGIGPFTLDLQLRTLNMENNRHILSAGEFALLKIFVSNPMRTLTRERLLELLHGPEDDHTDRGVDVQVWRLRRLLETNPSSPRFIQTVRSHGYVFVPDGARP